MQACVVRVANYWCGSGESAGMISAASGETISASVTPSPKFSEDSDDSDRLAIRRSGAACRMLVEAGPGTGKTEMAAQRIAALVRSDLSPGQLLVLSFSRSAVRTLTRRLANQGSDDHLLEELRHISIRTFDSWAFRMLRLMGRAPAELLSRDHDDNIGELVGLMKGPAREELRAKIGPRRHIVVDEFQDLPGVRGELVLRLLELIAPPDDAACGFTILGDPAQAIYGFAADNPEYASPAEYWCRIRRAYGDGLEMRILRRNYRAAPPLASLSSDLRSILLSERPDEEKLRQVREVIASLPESASSVDKAADTGRGSRAVLTRTNGEALRALRRLVGQGNEAPDAPVRLRAGSYASLSPVWIGALLRQLRAPILTRHQFGRLYDHLARTWDEPTRARLGLPLEPMAWRRLSAAAGAAEDATSFRLEDLRSRMSWPDAFPDDQSLADDGILVTTVHQSKGLEFDIVTLLDTSDDDDGSGKADAETGESEAGSIGEEASVGYVAITRAAKSLTRMNPTGIYRPPVHWKFAHGRRRLCSWWGGWVNMEMGLRGDVDPVGFADPGLLGGPAGVEALQQELLTGARSLEGRRVMLCKQMTDGQAVWTIHLQDENGPGRLIGRTSQSLTFDLLNVLHRKGYSLPRTILNLRIASVGTVTADGEATLDEPERTSRLWLGVSLFGTGDFRPYRRSKNG